MSAAAALERTAPCMTCTRSFRPSNVRLRRGYRRVPGAEAAPQRGGVGAKYYQTPEIFHCVADIVGDSRAGARGHRVEAEVIVLAGVHFMAETAKLLNPGKTVLLPDLAAGCSLAESITPADIRLLRDRHPGVPVVTYVNTSAAVKAESDICCTSGNVRKVVESLGSPRVILLPDEYLARNLARETGVEIISWTGAARGHERFHRRRDPPVAAGETGHRGVATPNAPRGGGEAISPVDGGDGRLRRQRKPAGWC